MKACRVWGFDFWQMLGIVSVLILALSGTQSLAAEKDEPFWKLGILGCDKARSRPHIPGLLICWNHGIRVFSTNEVANLFIGGRIQYDFAWFDPDQTLEPLFEGLPNNELRRGSVDFSGTFGRHFEFKLQPDFGSIDNETRDMWFGFRGIPFVGSIRIGRQKEPISLNEQTSSNDTTFMERSLGSAFSSNRTTGVTGSNSYFQDQITAYWGVFWTSGQNLVNYSGRFTTSRFRWSRNHFLHLGIGYTYRQATSEDREIKSRPESHLAPFLVDTGEFQAESEQVIVPEVAWVSGPLSVQAEYFVMPVNSTETDNPTFRSGYVQGSYFLTGEYRSYSDSEGHFTAVTPKRGFITSQGIGRGPGAWEMAFRFSALDLNSKQVQGGSLVDLTAGLNWYLSRYLRVSWNFIHTDVEPAGSANIFMMRLQLTFR